MIKTQTASNLLKEERRLQRRRHERRGMRVCKPENKLIRAQVHSSPAVITKSARGRHRNNVLLQYKNKLCLYMVEEINTAYNAREDYDSSSSSVGLSIDEEEKASSSIDYECSLAETTIRSLFYQVSSKVPSHIKKQLKFVSDVYFYELISAHIASDLSAFVESTLLDKCYKLLSLETFPALFAMLFYRYTSRLLEDEQLWSVFLRGLEQVFQHDANQGTIRLTGLYHCLTENTALKSQSKFLKILMRYYYYYSSDNEAVVDDFLVRFDITLDDFILENIVVLEKGISIKVSERYVQSLAKLKNIPRFQELKQQTIQQLESIFTKLTISGAPYYPSGELKKAAQQSLEKCFPKQKLAQRVISGMLHLDFKGVATDIVSTISPFNSL